MKASFFRINKKIAKIIEKACSNSQDKILDIGSGTSPAYRNKVKGNIVNFDIEGHKSVHVVGTADKLPFKKNSFDKVLSINSLYYSDDPKRVIEQVHALLNDKGVLIMVTPFMYPIHDAPSDKYRFTEFGIKELCKQFRHLTILPLGSVFNLPAVLIHSLIKGISLAFGKNNIATSIAFIVLFPLYLIGQLIALLDALDRTRRWPTYYLTIAKK